MTKPEVRIQRSEVRHRAFTLIELMVVVGIIVLLVGLTVGVTTALNRNSEVSQMEQTLKLLDAALQEWEIAAERTMTWGPNTAGAEPVTPGLGYDIDSSLGGGAQMENVLLNLMNTPESREILARINPRFLIEETLSPGVKQYGVVDPWDRRMVIVHPGRLRNTAVFAADNAALIDKDGTIRTTSAHTTDVNENRLGICQNRRLAFICRGPDGELGRLYLEKAYDTLTASELVQAKLADDNLYSYPLGRDRT